MSQESIDKNALTTNKVVTAISGHPEVDIEESAEIKALTNERLHAARALQPLRDFSPQEIEIARQFIDSLIPSASARVEGFSTVQGILVISI